MPMDNAVKKLLAIIFVLVTLLLGAGSALAYSSFPSSYYPGNQYGHEYTFYQGPWGEHRVYGAYGYYPNYAGYRPYGFRTYGHMYSPWQMRWGTTMNGPVYRNPGSVLVRY